MSSTFNSRIGGFFCLVFLGGCAVGPDYRRPSVDTPQAFKEAGDWKPVAPADQLPRGRWWEQFQDPVLNRFEERIDLSNTSLEIAEAQFRQAQAVAAAAHAGLFPTLGTSLSATRDRGAARPGGAGSSVVTPTTLNAISAALTANWELDLWGRLRRGQEAGCALAEASGADLESARLSLHAIFAQAYFDLRTADAQERLLDDLSEQYSRFLEVTKNRYNQGVAARSDIASAESQLKSIEAERIDLGLTRAQLEHSLAVLLAVPPANFTLPATTSSITLPDPPAVMPSVLLERRPDVAAAERRLAAASAQIGIAQAGYFPTLSLTASVGEQTSRLNDLLHAPTSVWALGSSFAGTLFDAGKVRAGVAQARGAYDGALSSYRQTVLTAFQEVEDNLAATRIFAQESTVQAEAVAAARETLTLTENQYKAGTVSHLNVITAQAALLDTERASIALLGRRFDAETQLLKATAGGW